MGLHLLPVFLHWSLQGWAKILVHPYNEHEVGIVTLFW